MGLNLALFRRRGELRDLWHAAGREWAGWPHPVQAFVALTWVLALPLALAPPTAFDALLYHLTVPKLYVQAGRIVSGIDIPPANYPTMMETLYLDALTLQSDVAAKLLHFTFGLLLVAGVYLAVRHYCGRRVGQWAVLFVLSIPMV
ncbi:MAG: hypothetical protein GXP41_10605, partial [Chloroflexi bacterium]|nr:hypothetical protein [Chloroflexota bacterium]